MSHDTRRLTTNEEYAVDQVIRRYGHEWRIIEKRDTGGTERWQYRLERVRRAA